MAEDWHGIAAEVDAALKSVGLTDEGYIATLAIPGEAAGSSYDPVFGPPTFAELAVIEDTHRLRDINGTLINQTRRTLTVSATGIVPLKGYTVAVGVAVADIALDTVWTAIEEVRPLAPAGIAVLYEIDLVN
jgi:hypothetical protein